MDKLSQYSLLYFFTSLKRVVVTAKLLLMKKVSPEEADKLLLALPDWVMDEQGRTIARTFAKDDFQHAIVFVNLVAKLAEEENHHPDMFVHGYNNVTISLSTHSAGGLTEADFLLAAKIDAL